jgi:DNA-binding response OmpR family regulator
MTVANILLVDDDEILLDLTAVLLRKSGFETTTATSVSQALKLISSQTFDVLLSDLHMPGRGDGLTVVSAMRHANPKAVTIVLSAFPEMDAAAQAILLQTDQILVKPMKIPELVEVIKKRLAGGASPTPAVESVATILEDSISETVAAWYQRVEEDEHLTKVRMSREERVGHLPKILMDLVCRLRSSRRLGSSELLSAAAEQHGQLRRQQGYSASMLVEESRMLQVSIFETLKKNMAVLDFSILLDNIMTIADEVDSQLAQAMTSYVEKSKLDLEPA